MSLSKSQKARLYGNNTQAEIKKPAPSQPRPKRFADASREDMQPEPQNGTSYMFAGVAFIISLLFFIYYHFMILPQISALAGVTAPELMPWFGFDHIFSFQQGLGVEGIEQYQYLHRSTGLVFPLIFMAAWLGMISALKYPVVEKRIMMMVPITYALVFIAGGFMIDIVVANPNGPVGLAALLVLARWVLLVLCLVQLVLMAVRLVRGKVDDFAEGRLPGQS